MIDLQLGDCIDHMARIPDASVDAVVTDPPYGLSFMGKRWDCDVPSVDVWRECLRVLKPGGHLLAFAGTRTQHRMATYIEDAGFEIRDMIAWVYGSGMPKSKNLNGDWSGFGTALKPAIEPITMARKPLSGTVASNVLQHGTGALNIDGCRVAGEPSPSVAMRASGRVPSSCKPGKYSHTIQNRVSPERWQQERPGEHLGRWPANLIHDGSDEVVAAFPNAPGQIAKASTNTATRKIQNAYGVMASGSNGAAPRDDAGSAARFFYCAKASKADRGQDNNHPTVKPTDLMRYLVRLVTPPGGLVLDPFMGAGSTGKAAVLEGFSFVGIEKDPNYFDTAKQRVEAAYADAIDIALGL